MEMLLVIDKIEWCKYEHQKFHEYFLIPGCNGAGNADGIISNQPDSKSYHFIVNGGGFSSGNGYGNGNGRGPGRV
jgi:hypothetical protein